MDDGAVKLIIDTVNARVGGVETLLASREGHDNLMWTALQTLQTDVADLKPRVVLKDDCTTCKQGFVTKRDVKIYTVAVGTVFAAIYASGEWVIAHLQDVHKWIEPFNPGGGGTPPNIQ